MAISEHLPDVISDQGEKATSRTARATSQTGAANYDAAAGLAVSGGSAAADDTLWSFVIDTSVLLSMSTQRLRLRTRR